MAISPIQHYQRTEWSLHCSMLSLTLKGRYPPSQHYQRTEWSLYCSMLSLTLKGRYTPFIQHYQRREWSLYCSMLSLTRKGRYSLCSTLSEDRVISSLFQCCHWDSKADIPPPIQHYQRTEWSLHCSMLSLTLKGRYNPCSTLSEDRVISLLFNVVIDTQKQIYPPRSTLSEDRVISLLFNVVIDIQRQIYPPIQHYQRTEWSLHCSMLSLTLKGRYTPPSSTLSEDRVISSLFDVVIDTQRQIYPPSQNY